LNCFYAFKTYLAIFWRDKRRVRTDNEQSECLLAIGFKPRSAIKISLMSSGEAAKDLVVWLAPEEGTVERWYLRYHISAWNMAATGRMLMF